MVSGATFKVIPTVSTAGALSPPLVVQGCVNMSGDVIVDLSNISSFNESSTQNELPILQQQGGCVSVSSAIVNVVAPSQCLKAANAKLVQKQSSIVAIFDLGYDSARCPQSDAPVHLTSMYISATLMFAKLCNWHFGF